MTDQRRTPEQMAIDIAVRLGLIFLLAYSALQIIGPFVMVVIWGVILTALYLTYMLMVL